jgi:ribosomal protein S18 acetylase RimI-like enzyme
MAALEDLLRSDGSRGVHFGVSARNERAIGFYRHLGYEGLHADAMVHVFGRRFSG